MNKISLSSLANHLKASRKALLTSRLVKLARTIQVPETRMATLTELVRRGADVNVAVSCEPGISSTHPSLNQIPLLALACALRDVGLVRLLLENGANPHGRLEPGGDTAIHLCLQGTRMAWQRTTGPVFDWDIHINALAFDLIRLLLEYHANPGFANDAGVNAFDAPVECYHRDEDKVWWDSLKEQYRLEGNIDPAQTRPSENQKRL